MQGGHWEATTVPQVRGDGGLSQVIIVEMTGGCVFQTCDDKEERRAER